MQLLELATRAYRETGITDQGVALETYQVDKAVDAFNDLVPDLLTNACGRRLLPKRVSASTTAQTGYRYMADTTAGSFTLTFPADADEGQMIGVSDVQERFATHNLTVQPNGQLFEGSRSTTLLSTTGFAAEWFYRAEAGWTKVETLAQADEVYFPADMIQPLTILLAQRISPPDMKPDPASVMTAYATFVRRYGRRGRSMTDPPISLITPSAPKRQAMST
jgi:hypothetical protein